MIPVPDEMLMAYADGELSVEQTQQLEHMLRLDQALRSRLEPFVETRDRLSSAFAHTLREPIPDRLIAAIHRAPVQAGASHRPASLADRLRDKVAAAAAAFIPQDGWHLSPAMAASVFAVLLVGAATGWMAGRMTQSSLIATSEQGLVPTGQLAHALETNASLVPTNSEHGQYVVPIASFRTVNSEVCREYRIRRAGPDADFAGLACRGKDGAWRVALHTETTKLPPPNPNEPFRTASGDPDPAVEALTARIMSGDAFGRKEEAAVLADGWQPREQPRQ